MADGIGHLAPADVAIVAVYLLANLAVALWTICTGRGNLKDYFLAGRSMVWWPIGLSLFASNIGTNQFIGMSGTGAVSGIAVIMFEWNAVFLLVLLGWVFLPVYIASGIYTMPEYLEWRFGGRRLRIYLSIVALLTYIFATASSDLYAGAIFINQTVGWHLFSAIAFILLITLVFTVFGGLQTVILTDAVSAIIMVVGGIALCIIGFVEMYGIDALRYKYMHAVSNWTLEHPNSTCGRPRDDAWHIFRDIGLADYPWLGTMLRTTFGSLWYWCANQVLVQRAMAAKSISHAKGGTLLSACLKLLPMFIIVLPGMISRTLYPNEVACADPDTCYAVCGSKVGCSNIAYPKLVVGLSPAGLRGLLVSSQIAAVVSSLTSIFNSASSMFTLDLWSQARPRASERELGIVGRLFVVVLIVIVVVWVPVIQDAKGGEIFKYVSSVNGYLGAPTCAMFVLAMFWSRVTEPGAFWGMVVAQAWGLLRFILDLVYPAPPCGQPDDRPLFFVYFHEYYHTASQILLAFVTAAVISLFTKPVNKDRLAGLTYWTRFEMPMKDLEKLRRRTMASDSDLSPPGAEILLLDRSQSGSKQDIGEETEKGDEASGRNHATNPSPGGEKPDHDGSGESHGGQQTRLEDSTGSTASDPARKSISRSTDVEDNDIQNKESPDNDDIRHSHLRLNDEDHVTSDDVISKNSHLEESTSEHDIIKKSRMQSFKTRLLDIACGGRTKSTSGDVIDEDEDHVTRVSRIHETSVVRRVLSALAVAVMTVTVFLYGFFY